MKPEEIKIGGVYDVRVKVIKKLHTTKPGHFEIGVYTVNRDTQLPMEYETTWFYDEESPAFVEITTENSRNNSEPAPKYDPCRRFRKGDKVEYQNKDGRELFEAKRLLAQTLTVVENEHKEFNRVTVEAQNGDTLSVPFYYLKLVTPVEELEPYCIADHIHGWIVYKDNPGNVVANFNKTHPHAKEAAEAECARLNAEHRKENSHE